jgi:multisubunit Na+/H+ antiporter MnhC subunit
MTTATRRPADTSAATRVAWALAILSAALAVASVALATFNGENPVELVANHHAIGIVNAMVMPLVGALILARDRRNLLAWLLIVGNLFLAVYNFADQYAHLALGLTARQLSLPGGEFASWLTAWTNVPGIVIGLVFLILLFPDGRVPSPRWRPLAWAGAVDVIVPTAILAVGYWPYRGPDLLTGQGTEPPLAGAMFWTAFQVGLALGAISVVALVLRYRRASTTQRQQIKWFAYGAILSIPLSLFPEARPWGPYLEFLGALFLIAGVGIGILRYRLWDIDRLVNRTLVYGLLTAVLAACYALGVLVLGHTVSAGRSPSSLVVAATTLVVAALFQPLRRRIQQAVDRRFNRRHYDAARTIEAFATRLRDHTDLHALSGELLAVVDRTLQPTQVSLWLRPTGTPPPVPEEPSWSARLTPAAGRDRALGRSGEARRA